MMWEAAVWNGSYVLHTVHRGGGGRDESFIPEIHTSMGNFLVRPFRAGKKSHMRNKAF